MTRFVCTMIVAVCMCSVALAADNAAKAEAKATFAAVCAECHGADGAKGIKGKSAEYVGKALAGYKAKTYGGPKKAIMEEKAGALSDAQIKALAEYAATL